MTLFSTEGQNWIKKVLLCLQQSIAPLVNTIPTSCVNISNHAFASHPHCYTDYPGSICFLPASDWVHVGATVWKGLVSVPGARQAFITANTCLGQWIGRLRFL